MEAWCRPPFWGFILSHFSVGYFLPDGGFSESHVLQPNGPSENHVSGSKAAIGVRHLEEYSERGSFCSQVVGAKKEMSVFWQEVVVLLLRGFWGDIF